MILDPRLWWAKHGTKILGFGSAAVGGLAYIDHETVQLIETTLGPTWGPRFSHAILITAGLMVARRGFRNSNPPPPPAN